MKNASIQRPMRFIAEAAILVSMPYARLLAALCLGSFAAASAQSDLVQDGRRAREAMLSRHYAEAVDIYRKMVAAAPDEPELHFNLALALHSSGRYREAVQELEPLRTTERANSKYWFLLGLGYLEIGRSAESG